MIQIYPPLLAKFIRNKSHTYIPRQIKKNEPLKIYKRYWSIYNSNFYKVDQIFVHDNIEYYSVRFANYMYGVLSYPVKDTYELLVDKNNIQSIDNIINNDKSYTGAEIKFWFFIKNINIDSGKFSGFGSFLDPNSNNVISDDKFYFLHASYKNGTYKDCWISLDRTKVKRKV